MTEERPDGVWQIHIALWLFAAAFFLLFGAFVIPDPGYDNVLKGDELALQMFLLLGSGVSFSLAMLLATVGTIVRAIWFLPGRTDYERNEADILLLETPEPYVSADPSKQNPVVVAVLVSATIVGVIAIIAVLATRS